MSTVTVVLGERGKPARLFVDDTEVPNCKSVAVQINPDGTPALTVKIQPDTLILKPPDEKDEVPALSPPIRVSP